MVPFQANKASTMTMLLSGFVLLCLTQMSLVLAESNASSRTTFIQEFVSVERKTGAFQVRWNISDDADMRDLIVIHSKVGGEFTTYSSPQFNYTQEFWITDLISNTHYNVCLTLNLEDDQPCPPSVCRLCVDIATIPLIREDSLIAIVVTIGVIFLLIITGCLCWHYAKKKQEDDEEEDSESLIASDESKQPILLAVPPTSNGPRRSVDFEDQDIPYITPPLDEVKRDQNNKRQEFFSQV